MITIRRTSPDILLAALASGLLAAVLAYSSMFDVGERIAFQALVGPIKSYQVKNTVFLRIDDAAIEKYGRWPWSRDRMAVVHKKLSASGAKAIAYDILFLEQDAAGLQKDRQFAEAIVAGPPTVLAASRNQMPYMMLFQVASGVAQSEMPVAENGLVYQMPEIAPQENWPQLAIALQHVAGGDVSAADDQSVFPFPLGGFSVPSLSVAELLSGDFDASDIKGKSVVVGVDALGITRPFYIDTFYAVEPVNGSLFQAWYSGMVSEHYPVQHLPNGVVALFSGVIVACLSCILLSLPYGRRLQMLLLSYVLIVGLNFFLAYFYSLWLGVMSLYAALFLVFALQSLRHIWLLDQDVRTDSLTATLNRREFDRVLQKEWLASRRNRTPLSLVMLDVDHFKQFNDLYGHVNGDDALRAVGRVLRKHTAKPRYHAARYGGEEFSLILGGVDTTDAGVLADQIRQAIEDESIPHEKSANGFVTISAGVCAIVPSDNFASSALIECADQALYQAKKSGRNCTVVDSLEQGVASSVIYAG